MKPLPLNLLFFFLFSLFTLTGFSQDELNGVAKIMAGKYKDDIGAGIIVHYSEPALYIVTAKHVICYEDIEENIKRRSGEFICGELKDSIFIELKDQPNVDYKVDPDDIYYSDRYDLALFHIELKAPPENFYKFRIGAPDRLERYDPVDFIGHPKGDDWFENAFTTFIGKDDSDPLILISTAHKIAGGNSGGPMLSRKKKHLVGMAYQWEAGNKTYSLSIDEVDRFLKNYIQKPNLIRNYREPVMTTSYILTGASLAGVVLGYRYNTKGDEHKELYKEFQDEEALLAKHNMTREELANKANKMDRNRNLFYIGAGAALLTCVTTEFLMRKKRKKLKNSNKVGFNVNGSYDTLSGAAHLGLTLKF